MHKNYTKLHYMLDDENHIVVTESVNEWIEWMENNEREVGATRVGNYFVSTVFMGIDHSYRQRIPVLFESMVFGGGSGGNINVVGDELFVKRYITWDAAAEGHKQICLFIASFVNSPRVDIDWEALQTEFKMTPGQEVLFGDQYF